MATRKEAAYKRIKIAGMLAYIPFILIASPWAGYSLGEVVEKKFSLGPMAYLVGFGLGMVVAIVEIFRIIKLTLKISNGD